MTDIDAAAMVENLSRPCSASSSSSGAVSLFDWHALKREFIAGGLAGSIGIFVGFPLDLVKVNLQVYPDRYKNARQCFQEMLRQEGVRGLYRGCLPPIVLQGLINSLMFFGESATLRCLDPAAHITGNASVGNTVLAGCAGGLLQCLILVPSEVIKCTMQAEAASLTPHSAQAHSQSAIAQTMACVRRVYRTSGLAGFYQGMGATALREAPSIASYFLAYRQSKALLTKAQGLEEANTAAILGAGAFAGALSWAAVYPLDVLKTYMQIAPDTTTQQNTHSTPHSAQLCTNTGSCDVKGNFAHSSAAGSSERGMLETARWLYRTHGARVFVRGLSATVLRAVPVNACTFYCYETIKRYLHLE